MVSFFDVGLTGFTADKVVLSSSEAERWNQSAVQPNSNDSTAQSIISFAGRPSTHLRGLRRERVLHTELATFYNLKPHAGLDSPNSASVLAEITELSPKHNSPPRNENNCAGRGRGGCVGDLHHRRRLDDTHTCRHPYKNPLGILHISFWETWHKADKGARVLRF